MRVRPTRLRRLRIRKAIGNATLATAILAVGGLYVSAQKSITLVVDGSPSSVTTLSASVGGLLDSTGIVLDGSDLVEPPPSTPLADGMTVVVDTRPLAAAASMALADVGVWVVDRTDRAPAEVALRPLGALAPAGTMFGTSRTVDARVVVRGQVHDVFTNASTVRELLSAMGIDPDRNDRVDPPPSTPLHDGITLRVVDIEFRTQRITKAIPYTTITSYSNELLPGEVRIVYAGSEGELLEVYRVKVVDGVVVTQELVRRLVLEEAIPRQRLMGQKTPDHGVQVGEASWYSFAPGSGYTAAHPWLPFGTVVRVTNLATGNSIEVTINDRGPFGGRVIDLSEEAFAALAPLGAGVIDVRLVW
jgi:resuscitation-promoting factor RpfB